MVNDRPGSDVLASLIEFSLDAIVLVDAAGVIQWANPATAAVLGYAVDDIVGQRARDLVEPADRDAWQKLVDGLFDRPDAPGRGRFRCRHKDGGCRRW